MNGIIDFQRMEIDHTVTVCEQSRRDQLLFQEELSEQNRDLLETRIKSRHEMEELKSVQELRIDEFSIRRLIENQDTINELTARIQELQNEVNCMNDSRDFKDAESVNQRYFHLIVIRRNAKPQQSAARYLEFAGYIGKFFCKSTSVFFVTLSRKVQSLDF